jgi:hypothetical protein
MPHVAVGDPPKRFAVAISKKSISTPLKLGHAAPHRSLDVVALSSA